MRQTWPHFERDPKPGQTVMLHLAGIRLPAELLKIGPGPHATVTVSNRSRRARAMVPVDNLCPLTAVTGIKVDNARGESWSTFAPLG